MLHVTSMVTTKNIFIKYTQKQMRRTSKCVFTKRSTKHQKGSNGINEGKAIRHIKNKNKIAKVNLSLLLIALYVTRLNGTIKRYKLAQWIK